MTALSPIQDGTPSVDRHSASDFINLLRSLREGQHFVVKDIKRHNLYQRLQYAETRHGVRAVLKKVADSEFQVFLRPKKTR